MAQASAIKFHDITPYDVTEEDERTLWKLEAKRLDTAFYREHKRMLHFEKNGVFCERNGPAEWPKLLYLLEHVLLTIAICRHDNEGLRHEYNGASSESLVQYRQSRRHLEERLAKFAKRRTECGASSQITADELVRYCAFVDYLTGVVGRFAVLNPPHQEWLTGVTDVLVKYAAKLKVLARDASEYAVDSLARGLDMMSQPGIERSEEGQTTERDKDDKDDKDNKYTDEIEETDLMVFLEENETEDDKQIKVALLMDDWASDTLQIVATSFLRSVDRYLPLHNLCSLVYKFGATDTWTTAYLHQEDDRCIFGSTDTGLIRQACAGILMCSDVASAILQDQAPAEAEAIKFARQTSRTMVTGVAGSSNKPYRLELVSVGQTIAFMVPLVCSWPKVAQKYVETLPVLCDLLQLEKVRHTSVSWIPGVVSLDTDLGYPKGVSSSHPLVQSLLGEMAWTLNGMMELRGWKEQHHHGGREHRATRAATKWNPSLMSAPPMSPALQRVYNTAEYRRKLDKEVLTWAIEECAVQVPCEAYVYGVMVVALVLTVGGIMIGIFLGSAKEKSSLLVDVDPFGITSYAWVLAAFVILVAKSIRVAEWPWRDFLLRRVTCCRLSELAAVTHMPAQILLSHLLSTEENTMLVLRGPYNNLFHQQGSDGFSVDMMPDVATLLESGIVVVEVAIRGATTLLVFLDLRVDSHGHDQTRTSVQVGDEIGEHDVVSYDRFRPGRRPVEIVRRKKVHGRVESILGIYNKLEEMVK